MFDRAIKPGPARLSRAQDDASVQRMSARYQPRWTAAMDSSGQGMAHTDMRGGSLEEDMTLGRDGVSDQRPGRGVEDPLHQPGIDLFREQQGQPAGGVDAAGNQIAPTDAEIKYRPQPIGVLNGPFHAPIDEPTTIGMEIQIAVRMSGNNAELPFVQDSERVGPSFAHAGSMIGVPALISRQSGFMSAAGIPNDRHSISRAFMIDRADNHGGTGSFDKHQLDIYTHPRYAIFNPIAIPNSGYRIRRTITAGPGNRLVFRVDKVPEACTVDGFTATAGPSPAQHDEVVLRP